MRFLLFFVSCLAFSAEFSTSLGDQYPYTISAITTDPAGNTYVVGSRQSSTEISEVSTSVGGGDVFVSKLDPNGKLLFTDVFAGKGYDSGSAIAVDPSGNIYIAGSTSSGDFPLSKALQTQPGVGATGFVMKLSGDGSTILYSTYFGGTQGGSAVSGLATDANGDLYLTGSTTSADFPHTAGMPFGPNPIANNGGVFFASISAAGDKILYSGALIFGPVDPFRGQPSFAVGVAVDASGSAYFLGNFGGGQPLPTTPGVIGTGGNSTGFAMKIANGAVSYLTSLPNYVDAMAVNNSGELYFVTGYVSKLNATASAMEWTNKLSDLTDLPGSISVDAVGNAWVGGTTYSATFPNQGWSSGSDFVAQLSAAGSLVYSALYPAGTAATSVSVDSAGLLHMAGSLGFVSTLNPGAPETPRVFYFSNVFGGNPTARISPAEVISIYGPGIGPAAPVVGAPSAGFYPKSLGGVQVTIDGVAMPLLFVSQNQINAVVPMGVTVNVAATVRVTNGATILADYRVWIFENAPQVTQTVLNQDGTINSESNPATPGSVVTFYVTGFQHDFSPLADGQVATVANNYCLFNCIMDDYDASAGAAVLYGGPAPGIVAGVTQINLLVPHFVLLGPTPLNITVYDDLGFASFTQTVWSTPSATAEVQKPKIRRP